MEHLNPEYEDRGTNTEQGSQENDENSENKEFLPLGAGAVLALIVLAVFLKTTGIQVQGWIRFAVIPVYVLLLCLCSWAVGRLIDRKEQRGKED